MKTARLGALALFLGALAMWSSWAYAQRMIMAGGGPMAGFAMRPGGRQPEAEVFDPDYQAGPCTGCNACDACDPCASPACGCGPRCNGICGTLCQPGFYAGYEFVWIRPHFQNQQAMFLYDGEGPYGANATEGFDTKFEVTPRVWFGYTFCRGLGVRTRYWQYDHDAAPQSSENPSGDTLFIDVVSTPFKSTTGTITGGDVFTAWHSLKLQTVDLEATMAFDWCQTCFTAFGGVRYAKSQQAYLAEISDEEGVIDALTLSLQHGFEGAGPTVGLEVQRQIGCSGFSLFGSTRGSILFGTSRQQLDGTRAFIANPISQSLYKNQEVRGISEIQLGLQYCRTLGRRTDLFVRGGYEGQLWHDTGGPTSDVGSLGLHGVSVGFGLHR